MRLITDDYCRLNKTLHEQNKHFGTSGQNYLNDIVNIIRNNKTQDVLDYGCGKSTLANNLPFTIKQYDPAIPKYATLPEPAEFVVCTDVLEHVEPECLDNVLKHLQSLVKKIGYFTACTAAALKTLPDGRNAHLTVKPARWWVDKFYEHFEIINLAKQQKELIVIVEPIYFHQYREDSIA